MMTLSKVTSSVEPSLRHRDRLGPGERPAALVLGDLVLLHQVVDALDAAVGDDARPVERRAEVAVNSPEMPKKSALCFRVWATSAFFRSALEGCSRR
jgi:hypothetical protein